MANAAENPILFRGYRLQDLPGRKIKLKNHYGVADGTYTIDKVVENHIPIIPGSDGLAFAFTNFKVYLKETSVVLSDNGDTDTGFWNPLFPVFCILPI